ncbi:MAG: sulfatase [Myxococcota bacterium]|nr:sulfatase [Myxococcota bacterium]
MIWRKLIDSPWFYYTLAGIVLVVAVFSQFERVDQGVPSGRVEEISTLADRNDLNVVFILIDTLRADRMGAYGYQRATTPNMDALAARGIRFQHVESQSSWTKASMASLWSGLSPEQTGVLRFFHALPTEVQLPAEILSEAGFRTAGTWRNRWVANNFGFGRGFDLYYRPTPNRPADNIRRHSPSSHGLEGTDLDSTQAGVEFILGNRTERFFLYLHYMDVHQYLYSDSSPIYGSSFSDIYDSALHWVDQNVGLLIDTLAAEGILDNTVIVIASDHGEAFFEHGGEGHARNLYWEVQNVPLIIAPPLVIEGGVVVEEPVANIDVWPTVLDLLGLPELADAEGRSLLPLVLAAGGAAPAPPELQGRSLFAQLDRSWGRSDDESDEIVSIRREPYRFIFSRERPEDPELFDHASDPLEKKNLSRTETELSERMSQEVQNFLSRSERSWEVPEVEMDEMMRAQLRALGYVLTPGDSAKAARRRREAVAEENP